MDGEIEERPIGKFDHSSWQMELGPWFRARQAEWKIYVRPELRIKVGPSRYRVPDLAVIDATLPVEQIITRPPIAVFEILSPEGRLPRIMRKLKDYESMGIQTISGDRTAS